MDTYTDRLKELTEERESLFTPGHINSYRRDRYERHDELNRMIADLLHRELHAAKEPA